MIPDSTTPRQGSSFIFYRRDKIIPRYIDRVANEYQNKTYDINYDLQYCGHKRNQHTFNLVSKADQTVSTCTVERDLDFLDSASFKFMTQKARQDKISRRASDLKEILLLLVQKATKPLIKR